MTLTVAIPRSLAAVPVLLLARDHPHLAKTKFFDNHDVALSDLLSGATDLLCTGFTELDRLGDRGRAEQLCTFVWGLSALMVREASLRSLADLLHFCEQTPGAELILPFAGSPLDLQVRALLKLALPDAKLLIANDALPETLRRWQRGEHHAAVFPEPLATLIEAAGQATRLADIADLWATASDGEHRSPQVSMFGKPGFSPPREFMSALESSIRAAQDKTSADVQFLSAELTVPAPILTRALEHVIFELPEPLSAARLEGEYRKVLRTI